MKHFTLSFLFVIFYNVAFTQHQIGHTTIMFQDASRGNRNIETEIYYPAQTAGDDVLAAQGTYPVIVFGHGFVMSWDAYQNLWEEFVPRGYIMVFPRTEGNILSTDHQKFGWDLQYLVTEMQTVGADAGSVLYNAVAPETALMGHSMGGGAAFLAADSLVVNGNQNIKTLVGLAPAESNSNGVSSINSALSITLPAVILSGSQDGVTPPTEHHIPMYDSLASDCKTFINVLGGAHCYFANSNFSCDFGEGTSSSGISITREEQHAVAFDFVNLWLDYKLKNDCEAFAVFNDSLNVSSRVTHNQTCTDNPIAHDLTEAFSICSGEDYTFPDGTTQSNITSQVTYTSNLETVGYGCDSIIETTINIETADNAMFTYTQSSYCVSGTDPIATLTGTSGGTYSIDNSGAINPTDGTIDLDVTGVGTYNVTYTSNGTCPASGSVQLNITVSPDATFNYSQTSYCQTGAVNPTFGNGASAGTFSSTPTGLSIDQSTGEIDLANSSSGNYIVTNLISASGGCSQATDNANLVVDALDDAAFNYAQSTFCISGTDPTATITGTSGGTYTIDNSGTISSSNGTIDLATTGVGAYDVTYTTNGTCPDASTITVTITTAPDADFSFTQSNYCPVSTTTPTFGSGASAGVFSAAPTGLSINQSTGEVDLANSSSGNYSVTNLITASGGCSQASANTNLIVDAKDDATFSYAQATFCISGTNPTATIGGTNGGTYTIDNSGTVSSSNGTIDLAATGVGTYDVTYTTNGTCPDLSTLAVTITDVPDATFTYAQTNYCPVGTSTPNLGSGADAGTFSATPTGLSINQSTGEVDLASSITGNYTITNLIAASGGCSQVTANTNLVVNALDDATFSYAQSTFCLSGLDPIATITGATGGTYTIDNSGTINSSNGTIDLAATGVGTYDITYTTNGTCPDASIVTITITDAPDASFTYDQVSYCPVGTSVPTFGSGASAGTFSATPTGLSIDQSTGEIDLANSSAGNYSVTNLITASGGCSQASNVQIVEVVGVDNSVSVTGASLTANQTGAVYQWLDCDNGNQEILGEEDMLFTAIENGNYAVEVTLNGCVETSQCVNVNGLSNGELEVVYMNDPYPNPTFGNISIELYKSSVRSKIEVLDLTGKVIFKEKLSIGQNNLELNIAAGTYMWRCIINKDLVRTGRIIIK